MLTHPDKRTKLGVELAGGITRSDRALHLAQEAYKDALRWPFVKNNPLTPSSPTPVPTCPTRQGPTPTESGPMPRPRRFPKHAICACDRKCSYGVSLVLRRVVIPRSPKPRLRRSPQKKKSTYGVSLATGRLGRKILPDPKTRLMGSKALLPLSQSSRPANPQFVGPKRRALRP